MEITVASPTSYSREPREIVEAKRGILRDKSGKILRSDEWRGSRKALLLAKKSDYENRISNINAELQGYGYVVETKSWWARFYELLKEGLPWLM